MQLSKDQIKQFQSLWLNHFGERISEAKAIEQGLSLINLVKAVYKPLIISD
ncbi:hypothetical protein OAR19_00115 [bacterium]|nr:hypothetical protein [bacterium]